MFCSALLIQLLARSFYSLLLLSKFSLWTRIRKKVCILLFIVRSIFLTELMYRNTYSP